MLVSCGLLTVCYLYGDPSTFPSYATTLGLLYAVYLGGQSVTDFKSATGGQ